MVSAHHRKRQTSATMKLSFAPAAVKCHDRDMLSLHGVAPELPNSLERHVASGTSTELHIN